MNWQRAANVHVQTLGFAVATYFLRALTSSPFRSALYCSSWSLLRRENMDDRDPYTSPRRKKAAKTGGDAARSSHNAAMLLRPDEGHDNCHPLPAGKGEEAHPDPTATTSNMGTRSPRTNNEKVPTRNGTSKNKAGRFRRRC